MKKYSHLNLRPQSRTLQQPRDSIPLQRTLYHHGIIAASRFGAQPHCRTRRVAQQRYRYRIWRIRCPGRLSFYRAQRPQTRHDCRGYPQRTSGGRAVCQRFREQIRQNTFCLTRTILYRGPRCLHSLPQKGSRSDFGSLLSQRLTFGYRYSS